MKAMPTPAQGRRNWAGNYSYQAPFLHVPRGMDELKAVVAAGGPLRVLGSRHSFNALADCEDGEQISLEHEQQIGWQVPGREVIVQAGVTYAALAAWLDAEGFALANMASLPHITIAGAVQTGTHGSGLRNGCLATMVTGVEMMLTDGALRWYTLDDPDFAGMVVALGALGIVTRLCLQVEPRYFVSQTVYEDLRYDALFAHFHDIFNAGYSVSVFTDWAQPRGTQLWVKRRVSAAGSDAPVQLFGACAADHAVHPLPGHDAVHCTVQDGIAGPWHERLPHFRAKYTPSSGAEIQSEYFVPFEHGPAAIRAVSALGPAIAPHLLVAELRTVAADALWLSAAYGRLSLALHFTWKPDMHVLTHLLPKIETVLAEFEARPHWGKVFTMPPAQVRALYPQADAFCALAGRLDRQGRFRNRFVRHYLFGEK